MSGGIYVDADFNFNPIPRGRDRNFYFPADYNLNTDQSEYGDLTALYFEKT